ncbi:isopenicillin N synthase family dioxygenase [Nocardia sp. NPDC052566]|uniref:isopenicillin N synthase family dioxygenase n=1 Tax=Nocardia sp. NPDC052566 TaxID=3364330 RepID=UPI0037C7394B
MDSIPTVELSRTVEAGELKVVAAEVDRACREIGFFRIEGHGISDDLIDTVYAVSRSFFDQPDHAKAKCNSADSSFLGYRGVSTLHASTSETSAGHDLKETFTIGLDQTEAGLQPSESEFFPANIWPDDVAGFRQEFESLYSEIRSLASRLGALFAAALEVPWDFFIQRMDIQTSWLTSINYPGNRPARTHGPLRFGAHRDRGFFTILSTTGPGLEVQLESGEWASIPNIPGSLLVNVGSMLAGWTGRRWVARMHRVIEVDDGVGYCRRRQTLVFFCNPNHDATLDLLPFAGTKPRPVSTGPSVTAGDYLRSMLALYR